MATQSRPSVNQEMRKANMPTKYDEFPNHRSARSQGDYEGFARQLTKLIITRRAGKQLGKSENALLRVQTHLEVAPLILFDNTLILVTGRRVETDNR